MAYASRSNAIRLRRSKVADGEAPPRKKPDDGDGGWLRPKEVGLFKKDPERQSKEAEVFTCKYKGCTREYTDAGSGSGSAAPSITAGIAVGS